VLKKLYNRLVRLPAIQASQIAALQNELKVFQDEVKSLKEQTALLGKQMESFAEKKQLDRMAQKYGSRIDVLADLIGSILYPESSRDAVRTDQEAAWSSKHGFRYVVHHLGEDWKKTRVPLWTVLLEQMPEVQSVVEFGCNIGANLKALHHLDPSLELAGVEINQFAVDLLRREGICSAHQGSVATADLGRTFDLVFSRGVLIHIRPDDLPVVFANMERHARKYLIIWETFSETPYHLEAYSEGVAGGKPGEGYQFWRDFAGDFIKQFPNWSVVSSGIDRKLGAKPAHGKLVWTLLQRA